MDARTLLKEQHREAKSLFKKALRTDEPSALRKLAEEIARKLKVHTHIEETYFYPALRSLGARGTEDLVNQAGEEHYAVESLLQGLSRLDPRDETFRARLKVLEELVRNHVRQEEWTLFRKARKLGKERLEELGAEMESRAERLEHGLLSRPALLAWSKSGTGGRPNVLLGTGLTAILYYFLDPQSGRRRRALFRDKLVRARNVAGNAAGKTARDLKNRARGLAAETRSRFAPREVPDDVLTEQIRSRLGRVVGHPSSIEVEVRNGRVLLGGPILAKEVDALLGELSKVRGIHGLEDRLEVHESPDRVPGLQGMPQLPARTTLTRENWPPAIRLMAGSAGVLLALTSIGRTNGLRTLLGLGGLALTARAATNLSFKRMVGFGADAEAIEIDKAIHIEAPVERVFAFWSNFENFPQFMTHVQEVRRTEHPELWHWTVAGPAGVPVEWEAEVTESVPDRILAWKTVPESIVKHEGVVRFDPEGAGTRLQVRMTYNPALGALGHAVARLLGTDPKSQMDDDLLRAKSYLETGRPAHDAAEPLSEQGPAPGL